MAAVRASARSVFVRVVDGLLHPEVRQDAEILESARILVGLLFVGAAAATIAGIARLVLEGAGLPFIAALVGAVVSAAMIGVIGRLRQPLVFGDALIVLTLSIVATLALREGGLHSPAAVWLPILPLVSTFVGHHLSSRRTTWLTLGAVGIIGTVEHLGLLDSAPAPEALRTPRMAALLLAVIYVAVTTWFVERARAQAQTDRLALQEARSRWVSIVSHELRSPVTAIRGALGLLRAGAVGELPGEAGELVALADRASVRLSRLVDDVLDVDRIERDEFTVTPERIDLAELVREAAAAFSALAQGRSVTLTCDTPTELVVRCDSGRLHQVLANILGNALSVSQPGQRVTLRLRGTEEGARVEIADQGPGVPIAMRDRIFDRFVQVDDSESRRLGGAGLGLFVCRRVVELHGGRIGVESASGGGASFWFTLPAG